MPTRKKKTAPPKQQRLHLDRRASQLVAIGPDEDGDGLLTTPQMAKWLGVSEAWLQIGRMKSRRYGPPYVRLAGRIVRYKRSAVLQWLEERATNAEAA